jgi:biopolymer transport protein ExbB
MSKRYLQNFERLKHMNNFSQTSNLFQLWHHSDVVIRSLALVLLVMSIVSWTVILRKSIRLFQQRKGIFFGTISLSVEKIQRMLATHAYQQQGGMVWLAVTSSAAPFIGLLGTVWGIYHALSRLGQQESTMGLSQVAGPVGEALVMTALGLAVAIPALMAYNILTQMHHRERIRLRHQLEDAMHYHPLASDSASSSNNKDTESC